MSGFWRLRFPGLGLRVFSVVFFVALLALAATVMAAAGFAARAQAAASPHLRLVDAEIEETGTVVPGQAAARQSRLWIELEDAPTCGAQDGNLRYGFLVDADDDPATGVFVAGLGIDARITATCDPPTGTFTSPAASVSIDGDTLNMLMPVGLLPSVEFSWIAFGQDAQTLTRLPRGAFAIEELARW